MKKHDDDTIAYCLKNGITYNAFGVMRGCLFTDPTVAALAKKYKTSAAQARHASHAQCHTRRHSTRPACCMMLPVVASTVAWLLITLVSSLRLLNETNEL